jgi:xylulokinase/erythritol kinase
MNDLVFCLDSGTTAIKAAAYTPDGELVALYETPNGALRRNGVRAEQEMGQTRDEALATLRGCAAKAQGRPRGLIITAQGEGVWPLDAARQPLGRALTWLDGRAVDLLVELEASGALAAVAEITGAQPTAASPSVQLLWLQRHEPERYGRIAHVLRAKEWLFHALTGEFVSEPSTAMLTWGDWRRQVVADGIEPVIGLDGAMRRLPALASIADSRRPLAADAAALTGLPQGLPVMLGPSDVQATAIGLGVGVKDGVYRASIFGTSAIHVGYFPDAASLPAKPRGAMLQPSIDPGAFLCVHPCFNGSTTFRHVQALVGGDATAPSHGALSGSLLHPFFEPGGERAPITDAHARASLFGITPSTTPFELQRAAREALAFNARLSHDGMGRDTSPVAFGGGLAQDDGFAALLATVLGRRVIRPPAAHAGLAGIGLIATHQLGGEPLRALAARWLGGDAKVDEPAEGDEARFLARKFALHDRLLATLQPLWPEIAALQDEARRLNEGTPLP